MVCRKQDSQNMRPCEISSAGSPKSRGVGWASEPKGQRFCGHGGSPLGRLRLRLGLASLGCVGSLKSPKKSMVSIQQRYSLTRQRSELRPQKWSHQSTDTLRVAGSSAPPPCPAHAVLPLDLASVALA